MMTSNTMTVAEQTDAELVGQSLGGNREAFGVVVARYQSLICSLAYSATGSVGQSEELAQETFIAAWKQLCCLREPAKLRAWLCGIARNCINNNVRRKGRDPLRVAEPLDQLHDPPAVELTPLDHVVTREEEALLWRSLETIPDAFREPLVLFYREQQSIERVAQQLDLSEDAVKQRLSRGRKLLHEQVVRFVEGTLQRTTPGKTFTVAVMASLPIVATSTAGAATVAGTAVKASAATKGIAAAGVMGAILGPVIGILGGALGAWASIKNTRSPRERRFMIRQTVVVSAYVLLFMGVTFAVIFGRGNLYDASPRTFGWAVGGLSAAYCVGLLWIIRKTNRHQRRIQVEDETAARPVSVHPQTRGQKLWQAYGSMGGGSAGALAWIIARSIQEEHWLMFLSTILFGVALVLVQGGVLMKYPDRSTRVILQTLVALGLFTVMIGVVHWHDWTAIEPHSGGLASSRLAVLVGAGLTLIGLVTAAFRFLFRRPAGKKTDFSH